MGKGIVEREKEKRVELSKYIKIAVKRKPNKHSSFLNSSELIF